MSYCRWSTDNFKSDIYAYKSHGNQYIILVASSRIVGEPPLIDYSSRERIIESNKARSKFMQFAERVPIGLPHDGELLIEHDLPSFRARLEALRDMGYRVPAYVFAEIDADIAEITS